MYRLITSINISSAHKLENYKGDCSKLHGHNWTITVSVKKSKLDKIGMLIDFKILKQKLNESLKKKFDHKYLNDVVDFNPTAENLARYIYYHLGNVFSADDIIIEKVSVMETENNIAEYY